MWYFHRTSLSLAPCNITNTSRTLESLPHSVRGQHGGIRYRHDQSQRVRIGGVVYIRVLLPHLRYLGQRLRRRRSVRVRQHVRHQRRHHHIMILPNMLQHIRPLHEALITLRAGVRSLVRMTPPVRYQVALAREILRTNVALERPLRRNSLCVRPLMEQQITLQRKRFSAFRAGERPFSRMAAHVIHKVLLPRERFRAHRAIVLRVSRMLS